MLINLKVKTLDAQTHELSIDNEITVREFKDKISEKTNIAADQQRIIYCGRVLADEKQLKEYDVDGKVVHVAERPPPSQRGPSTNSTFPNESNARERAPNRGMRNSPLFRALDGMVVGTMAIPVNPGMPNNGQVAVNPFASSPSFCMNRITVARHMLECANNIAAYLEDPERGLNNTSLDILARGRWTMESTVVEVDISAADLRQNQNIVDMVQGAVSAALRRNLNTNVTVVQLPTVFGSDEAEGAEGGAAQPGNTNSTSEGGATPTPTPTPSVTVGDGSNSAAVIIEDVIEGEEDGATNASSNAAQAGSTASNSSSSSTSATSVSGAATIIEGAATPDANADSAENSARRRTGTSVLATVIEQMRTVQERLNPFVQQYYELLRNDPVFDENDTTARENAQRLYDRVSEALHYMSHALHAISDLMLDVSQPAPRHLTCRPILVEQSGYVSSNNYLSTVAAAAAAAARQQIRTHQPNTNPTVNTTTNPPTDADTAAPTPTTPAAVAVTSSDSAHVEAPVPTASRATDTQTASSSNNTTVEDPVDDPVVVPMPPIITNVANAGTDNNDNQQLQMARFIQAVVNSAPIDTEFHVQINAPVVSFGVPIPLGHAARNANATPQQQPPQQQQQQQPSQQQQQQPPQQQQPQRASENSTSSPSANVATAIPNAGATNQARVNTATLPTTSTQTRSTSRPQLQIGNGWNGRFIPANVMSSFDRFLPCNSHHIHEPENANQQNSNNMTTTTTGSNSATTNPHHHNFNMIGSTMTTPRQANANITSLRNLLSNFAPTTSSNRPPSVSSSSSLSGLQQAASAGVGAGAGAGVGAAATAATATGASAASGRAGSAGVAAAATGSSNSNIYWKNLRRQLVGFVMETMFEGRPINDATTQSVVNRAARWFGEALLYLPQYEKPEYDSRDSVIAVLRRTLPLFIELINDNVDNLIHFEQELKRMCDQFIKRVYSVLCVCVGTSNAELYWGQLMRSLSEPVQSNFCNEARQFLFIYINAEIPSMADTADAQQFIVHRDNKETPEKPTPMETDEENIESASSSVTMNNNNQLPLEAEIEIEAETATDLETGVVEPLPNVIIGSEPWHRNFPNDWLPIITRDIQTQAENPPTRTSYSDAYISGMSAKRRKMIQNSKQAMDVSSLVASSVQKAIQVVGVQASTASNQPFTADEITDAIASDNAVQSSCKEAVRSNVRERLKKDPDYEAEKYPQITKFIKK